MPDRRIPPREQREPRARRSAWLRTDVTTSLAQQPLDTAAAEARLAARHGVHNVNPIGFVLGVLAALFATSFALRAALDEGRSPEAIPVPSTPPSSATPATEPIYIELE